MLRHWKYVILALTHRYVLQWTRLSLLWIIAWRLERGVLFTKHICAWHQTVTEVTPLHLMYDSFNTYGNLEFQHSLDDFHILLCVPRTLVKLMAMEPALWSANQQYPRCLTISNAPLPLAEFGSTPWVYCKRFMSPYINFCENSVCFDFDLNNSTRWQVCTCHDSSKCFDSWTVHNCGLIG